MVGSLSDLLHLPMPIKERPTPWLPPTRIEIPRPVPPEQPRQDKDRMRRKRHAQPVQQGAVGDEGIPLPHLPRDAVRVIAEDVVERALEDQEGDSQTHAAGLEP